MGLGREGSIAGAAEAAKGSTAAEGLLDCHEEIALSRPIGEAGGLVCEGRLKSSVEELKDGEGSGDAGWSGLVKLSGAAGV